MTSSFASRLWSLRSLRPSSGLDGPALATTSLESVGTGRVKHDEPDLRELNAALHVLVEVFPNVQPEVFREMLSSFSEESRLQVITETLLKHGSKWVRGRHRMPTEDDKGECAPAKQEDRTQGPRCSTLGLPLTLEDTFRSGSYKNAVKMELYREFNSLSHSRIKAVLAEHNWSYTKARPVLQLMAARSWKALITNFFTWRKAPSIKDHPLVVWPSEDSKKGLQGPPILLPTKSKELDAELYDTLILPELEKLRADQISTDVCLALQLEESEAEDAGELYDCECCFTSSPLSQMSTCTTSCHYICFECIRRSINAALYDQCWARNIDPKKGTLRCLAPTAGTLDQCDGSLPLHFVERALSTIKDGKDTLRKVDERLAFEALQTANLKLVQCPFCPYSELDTSSLFSLFTSMRLRQGRALLASIFTLELIRYRIVRFAFQLSLGMGIFFIALSWLFKAPSSFSSLLESALRRIYLKRRGLRFQCLSPSCSRASCLACFAPWHDPHACHQSQAQSLRLTLERATTDAVKRTCPKCNLGFVKSEGCNKLVCLCGYTMCYICRQDLSKEGYHHFCQHFRAIPGSKCTECDKCDLYRVEDEDVVLQKARDAAEKEWWERQGSDAKRSLEKGVWKELRGWDKAGSWSLKGHWSWDSWLEKVLDSLFV
ncbi:hypothetical protein M011DRAFT_220989 [Sporormia fimetaria CBS 119925]|uniref:RING-type domain-containing protein n=1 Tax=Sporormia fimetaria CBS 119925 TaxID=1340428 RepID=A0A6A6V0U2_9PLEO|nr:hypothetical protein M011DRAFT_220989 [Sporormia fimetaria CBS 119925]